MKLLLTTFISMSFLAACHRAENNTILKNSLPAQTLLNVSYGPDTLQQMDIYLPASRSADSTKILLLIHGGGWTGGDKTEFLTAIPILQQKLPHYAIVNINYRLANQKTNHFPTQEQDVQAALKTVLDKQFEYQVSKDVVLLGASAGAHLALLQAYKYSVPVVPKAVISFFGPTDMTELYNSQANGYYKMGLAVLVGGTPASKPEVFQQSSPIYFAGRQSVPTLLLHGANDPLVPVAQSRALKAKLQSSGVPVELVVYPGEGHGWKGANLVHSFNAIEAFLKNAAAG